MYPPENFEKTQLQLSLHTLTGQVALIVLIPRLIIKKTIKEFASVLLSVLCTAFKGPSDADSFYFCRSDLFRSQYLLTCNCFLIILLSEAYIPRQCKWCQAQWKKNPHTCTSIHTKNCPRKCSIFFRVSNYWTSNWPGRKGYAVKLISNSTSSVELNSPSAIINAPVGAVMGVVELPVR